MAELPLMLSDHAPQHANSVTREMCVAQPSPVSVQEIVDVGRCARLVREVRDGRTRGKLWKIDILWIVVVGVLVCIRVQSDSVASTNLFSVTVALSLAACGALIIGLKVLRRLKYEAALAGLLKDNHKHNLPVLIEIIPYVRGKQASAAKARLTQLLLSMDPTDRILTGSDFTRLHAMLRWPDVALVCAILHAIEKVGTLASLPAVTRLARGRQLARHAPAVKETAILCTDALKDQMAEASSIGLMLGLMHRRDAYTTLKHEARRSLIVMFPRLTSDDRRHFKSEERRLLYACLEMRDVELILVVLKMLPIVGLLDALPHVNALAAGKNAANRNIHILRDHARVCQELLGGRLKALDSRNILLRSSEASPDWRGELVRPLHGSVSNEPEELMRSIADRGWGAM